MTFLPYVGFALVALAAIGFATFGLWRDKAVKARGLLILAIALFMLGIGSGTYWMVGRPELAIRAAEGLQTREVNGLIPYLIARVRKAPGDLNAWVYLGRAYMTAGDAGDAAKVYGRAVTVARLNGAPDADLQAAYGVALMAAEGGTVGPDAQKAFTEALARDPHNPVARYFLGQAKAEKGDKAGALTLWQGLLAEVPAKAPLHKILVDRIALLTAQGGAGSAPDPRAMVANLAARLKANPDDAPGWQELIRAYTVLGQPNDAKAALVTARKQFAGHADVLAALKAEAGTLKLD